MLCTMRRLIPAPASRLLALLTADATPAAVKTSPPKIRTFSRNATWKLGHFQIPPDVSSDWVVKQLP